MKCPTHQKELILHRRVRKLGTGFIKFYKCPEAGCNYIKILLGILGYVFDVTDLIARRMYRGELDEDII